MPSVRDIAKKAGVSAATVSRALKSHPDISIATRQRVVRAANLVGYQSVTSPTACSVGLVTTQAEPWLSPYDCLLLNGIHQGLAESRLDIQIVSLHRDRAESETYTEFFTRRGLRGVILQTYAEHRDVCRAIAEEGFPSVVLADRFDEPNVSYVCCDSTDQSANAIQHLIDLGHRRIALVVQAQADRDHLDRMEGYRRALQANGIEPDESLVIPTSPTGESGANSINALMSRRDPPTAVFYTDPFSAIGALCRAQKIGLRIPAQLSVVGVDDGNLRRRVFPVLTAVCQPTQEIGRQAALWLSRRIAGEVSGPFQYTLHPTLEINQSTAAPPVKPVRLQPDGTPLDLNS